MLDALLGADENARFYALMELIVSIDQDSRLVSLALGGLSERYASDLGRDLVAAEALSNRVVSLSSSVMAELVARLPQFPAQTHAPEQIH